MPAPITVCATTAQLPGFSACAALKMLHAGVHEGAWGQLSTTHVQICPQTAHSISEEVAEGLRTAYPTTQLRLHANARVLPQHVLWDISSWSADTAFYYAALADRMQRFGATTISCHAGYQDQCNSHQMWDNLSRIQECMDVATKGCVEVAVEGLYPSKHRAQLLSMWQDYEELLRRNVPFALDLSHIKIVASHTKHWDMDLTRALLLSPFCREIHVSDNDGHTDRHATTVRHPYWWDLLHECAPFWDPKTVVFSEGNLLRAKNTALLGCMKLV